MSSTSSTERPRRDWLEALTNLSIICACIVVSVSAVRHWVLPSRVDRPPVATYNVGERIAPPSGVRFDTHAKTVLLFVSSGCKYCTASMPFYAKLAAAKSPGGFNVVVLGGESQRVLAAYISDHKLDVGDVVSVTPGAFRANVTPTLVIVDRGGRVEGAWSGALGNREGQVERALGLLN